MYVRQYRDSDWEAVRTIYDLSKPDEMRGVLEPSAIIPLQTDADMLALFRDSRIVVMDDEGTVVGFAGRRGPHITWLFVHPENRRKGIGRTLVLELLSPTDGEVDLNVAKANHAARRLYERLGFTTEREFVGEYNGRHCEAIRLRWCGPIKLSSEATSSVRKSPLVFGHAEAGITYTVRPGGYLVVRNSQQEVAVVETKSGFFLPGGGLQTGESAEQAAVREAAEECGLEVRILAQLGEAHEFVFAKVENEYYRKEGSFFVAEVIGQCGAIEQGSQVRWFSATEAAQKLKQLSHRWAVSVAPA